MGQSDEELRVLGQLLFSVIISLGLRSAVVANLFTCMR